MNYKIILFGGNRLNENAPLSRLALFLKRKKIDFLVVTEKLHFKKNIDKKNSFGDFLKKNHIDFIIKEKIDKKFLSKIVSNKTIGLSLNSIWKFKKDIIKLFNNKLFNYHAASLPEERGAANISWRILSNNYRFSINIHHVDKDYDTGNIVFKKTYKILKKNLLPKDYLEKINIIEKEFLEKFIINILKSKLKKKIKQSEKKSFYWPKLDADKDGKINWDWDAENIVQFIKAFSKPYNGAYGFLKGKKIKIFNAKILKINRKFHPFQNGIIFRVIKNDIYISNHQQVILINLNDTEGMKESFKFYLGKRFN